MPVFLRGPAPVIILPPLEAVHVHVVPHLDRGVLAVHYGASLPAHDRRVEVPLPEELRAALLALTRAAVEKAEGWVEGSCEHFVPDAKKP